MWPALSSATLEEEGDSSNGLVAVAQGLLKNREEGRWNSVTSSVKATCKWQSCKRQVMFREPGSPMCEYVILRYVHGAKAIIMSSLYLVTDFYIVGIGLSIPTII